MSGSSSEDVDGSAGASDPRRAIEHWFIRHGLPHFKLGYSATTDVFTRAWPVLALVFVAEATAPLDDEFPLWLNVVAVLVGTGTLAAGLAWVNHRRGRSRFSRPDRIGVLELVAFVVVPAIPPVLFEQGMTAARHTVTGNVALLVGIYVVNAYALVALSVWATGQMLGQLRHLLNLMVRAFPLMLLFGTFLFLTTELWQVVGRFDWVFWAIAMGLPFSVGTLFVSLRIPDEVRRLSAFGSWEEVRSLTVDTPAAEIAVDGTVALPDFGSLPLRARVNVVLVMLFSVGVQIALVAALIAAFFVAFGLLVMREDTIASWIGAPRLDPDEVVWRWTFAGEQLVFAWPLVKVAGFVAAFSGLQFTVSILTDPHYREAFFEGLAAEIRQAMAVRAVYLEAIDIADG